MATNDKACEYVREVTENTRACIRELCRENETLKEQLRLALQDRSELAQKVATLHRELEEAIQGLAQRSTESAARSGDCADVVNRYKALEQQTVHLGNLYVASYRLHETLEHADVLTVIQEIIINLVGCEDHAIYEVGDDGRTLTLAAQMGLDGPSYPQPVVAGALGQALASGEAWVRPDDDTSGSEVFVAVVPLVAAKKVIGVITLRRLLPQKRGIEALDRELFALLGAQAGMALYCTSLHARLGSSPAGH